MGLDTSHDCWHGAYSSFKRWRAAVQTAAGLDGRIPWNDFTEANYQGDWRDCELPKTTDGEYDGLLYLLVHSDCDGQLWPAQIQAILPRLKELEDRIEFDPYRENTTVNFIKGLEDALSRYEVVDFH